MTLAHGVARLAFVEKDDLFCSFCGKDQASVRKLIAGGNNRAWNGQRHRRLPLVCICNECIDLCNDVISAAKPKKPK